MGPLLRLWRQAKFNTGPSDTGYRHAWPEPAGSSSLGVPFILRGLVRALIAFVQSQSLPDFHAAALHRFYRKNGFRAICGFARIPELYSILR